MSEIDTLGRATFDHIPPRWDVQPNHREVRWLKHLERHGPLSSVHLYELTRDTHSCRDTALRSMQKLRAGGYLALPPQQRSIARAECRPYIYDLTSKASRFLSDHGLVEATVRPTGHWWHASLVSLVTSSIDIEACRLGYRFVPAHEILARSRSGLPISVHGRSVVPDQVFALDYGGSYRAFAVEVDRGTEPFVSSAARKSCEKSINLYREIVCNQAHRPPYGLRTPLLILWIFTSNHRAEVFLDLVARLATRASQLMLVTVVPIDHHPAGQVLSLLKQPWRRARNSSVVLERR